MRSNKANIYDLKLIFHGDDHVLFNDLTLSDSRGNVDHLVIGPNGLFVIESKTYSGYVKCFGDTWYVNGRKKDLAPWLHPN
jgi:Nuclease-related domain